MIPLKMRRLFFGFTPRRLLGINGSILAHCPSLNQNKFARICWPPIRLTNPLNLNMVNWVLTLGRILAEGEGFEPPTPCEVPVFKTGAFNQTRPPLRSIQRAGPIRSSPFMYGRSTDGTVTVPSAS